MKKGIVLGAMVMLVAVALAGCGNKESTTTNSSASTPPAPPTITE